MLPFAEHKKQVLTCVPCAEQREHVLNMFNTREHRTTQHSSTKQPATPLHCFSTTYPQHFSTDKKTEATVLAASVGKTYCISAGRFLKEIASLNLFDQKNKICLSEVDF